MLARHALLSSDLSLSASVDRSHTGYAYSVANNWCFDGGWLAPCLRLENFFRMLFPSATYALVLIIICVAHVYVQGYS